LQAFAHAGDLYFSLTLQLCELDHISIPAKSYHERCSGTMNICQSNEWSSHNAC